MQENNFVVCHLYPLESLSLLLPLTFAGTVHVGVPKDSVPMCKGGITLKEEIFLENS